MLIFALLLLASYTQGVPVAEDGGVDMSKFSSYSSSMSNLNGDTQQDSYIQEGAETNGIPTFGLKGEHHSDNDDVQEDWDVLEPEDNVHVHHSKENEEESTMVEPLDDYFESLGGSGDVMDKDDFNSARDYLNYLEYNNSPTDYDDDDDDYDYDDNPNSLYPVEDYDDNA